MIVAQPGLSFLSEGQPTRVPFRHIGSRESFSFLYKEMK